MKVLKYGAVFVGIALLCFGLTVWGMSLLRDTNTDPASMQELAALVKKNEAALVRHEDHLQTIGKILQEVVRVAKQHEAQLGGGTMGQVTTVLELHERDLTHVETATKRMAAIVSQHEHQLARCGCR